MINYPKLQPSGSNTFKVLEDYTYLDVIVPAGFETNGGDIPRVFWSIVPPFKPKFLPAIVLHDYLIRVARCKEDIVKANEVFCEVLLLIENSYRTRVMVSAVDWYWKYYRRYNGNFAK